jgi:hypothetical protein
MLTPDDQRSDGQFTSYLGQAPKWRRYDAELFDILAEAVPSGRNLGHVGGRQILPGAILIDTVVPDSRALRAKYFADVQSSLHDAALVFFDPDNGIEIESCPPGRKNSSKYLAWSEIAATYNSGRSVLIYQHFPRKNRETYIRDVAQQLVERTDARAVSCFSTANVAFFLVSRPEHEEALRRASEKFGFRWAGQVVLSRHSALQESQHGN